MTRLPDLSRFELQCLRLLWARKEGTVRDIHRELDDPPSYSTVRKIVDRLEEKGAVKRVRMEGKALLYRPAVSAASMMHREVRRFLDNLFDGSAAGLVAQLAEMDELSLDDLRELERRLQGDSAAAKTRRPARRRGRG